MTVITVALSVTLFLLQNKINFCEEIIYIYLDFFIKNMFNFYKILIENCIQVIF